jgi:hypothetical protein
VETLAEAARKRLFMNLTIDEYATEITSRVSAIKITQTMVFIVIRLFSNLYGAKKVGRGMEVDD